MQRCCASNDGLTMDRLEALRTFVAVVDHEGFASASRALDLAPAVVTRRVADLEQKLGVRLLNRTTRSVSLTSVGTIYLERVRGILAALEEADREASSSALVVTGRVRVSAPGDFIREVLAPEFGALRLLHPQLEVLLIAEEGLRRPSEQADLTLVLDYGIPLDGDFVARQLACTTAMVCGAPGYLAAHPAIEHPSQLDQHPMLLPSLTALAREFTFRRDGKEGLVEHVFRPGRPPLESDNSDAMVAAALAGYGLVGALSFVTAAPLQLGRLVRVLPEWQVGTWRVYAVYQRQASLTTASRMLLEHLRARLGGGDADPWLTSNGSAPR
jgi:DNA-binding transcriptional LysR family regulator